jgi:hypothetical protein
MDILVGKKLIDTYGKRSSTLHEKVSTSMTVRLICNLILRSIGQGIRKIDRLICGGLHGKVSGQTLLVILFLTSRYASRRPESIRNGNYRLHISENLRNGNCSLSKDISGALDSIEAASKAAYKPRRRKKRRTEISLDSEASPSMQRTSNISPSSANSSRQQTSGTTSNGNIQPSPEHPDKVSTSTGVPTYSGIHLNNRSVNQTTTAAGTMCIAIETSDISSLVHLLK